MKRLLAMGVAVFTVLLALAGGSAFADIDVELEITNKTTGEVGTDVSASAGDIVQIWLRVTNHGEDQEVEVNVVGGVVGCIVDVTAEKDFREGKTRKKKVQGRVPQGHTGTFSVDVEAVGEEDGCTGNASASVDLGSSKVTASTGAGAGVLQRAFVRMLANALLNGISNDPTTDSATFGQVKHLYR